MIGSISVVPTIKNSQHIRRCFNKFTPEAPNYHMFRRYLEAVFRCLYNRSSFAPGIEHEIGVCVEPIERRAFPPQCFCTGNESLLNVPISVAYDVHLL